MLDGMVLKAKNHEEEEEEEKEIYTHHTNV